MDKQTRGEMLGHAASDITEHYSMADLGHLFQQVNLITMPIHAHVVVKLKRRNWALVG